MVFISILPDIQARITVVTFQVSCESKLQNLPINEPERYQRRLGDTSV